MSTPLPFHGTLAYNHPMFGLWKILATLVAGIALMVLSTGPALAQEQPTDPDAYVGGTTTIAANPSNIDPAEASADPATSSVGQPSQVEGATLAITGGDITALALVGLCALVTGGLILNRRRSSGTAA